MNQVVVIIRRSFDFYYNNTVKFVDGAAVNQSHIEGIERSQGWWHEIFGCSWQATRQRIADIVMRHTLSCRPDAVVLHSETNVYIKDSWIIPLDDDDLLDIRIIHKLRNMQLSESAYWPTNKLLLSTEHEAGLEEFPANSYAISSDYFNSHKDKAAFYRHMHASKNLNLKAICMQPCGLKINHPASIGILKLYHSKDDCIAAVNKFRAAQPTRYKRTVNQIQECFKF